MNLKRSITILSAVLVALVLFAGLGPVLGVPQSTAQAANSIGDPVLLEAPALAGTLSTPTTATPMVAAGYGHTVGLKSDGTVVAVGDNYGGQCNVSGWSGIVQVAARGSYTVGLKSDGTVVAVGDNGWGQCNVSGWSGIVQVAAGGIHTVGLKSDGTVVAVGYNNYGQCEVGGWSGIVQVAAGGSYTVGLKSDGTVVAVGYNNYGQCEVGGWSGIVQVAAGGSYTVGLKSDGTVVAVGDNGWGQCNVSGWSGIVQVAAGGSYTVGLKSDGTVVAVGYNSYGQCNVSGWSGIVQVAAGGYHTVGLKSDGTVVAVGYNSYGQCNVSGWSGIVQVTTGYGHTVGLKSDGTVVAVGRNNNGQCNVSGWSGIVQVAAGEDHTVGLKSDGTVVAVGYNSYGQCNVSGWSGIAQVAAGEYHTVGLKSDGMVVAVGYNSYGQCNVSGWSGIAQVAAGEYHTVGLKSDGTVVAVGDNSHGQCEVGGWSGIVQVAAGYWHTVGLKSDGTVVAVGYNGDGECEVSGWSGIVQISAGPVHTVGLKSDGTVVAVGDNSHGQCEVGGWSGIVQVAAGYWHTVGLKSDGSVRQIGGWVFGESWDLGGGVPPSPFTPFMADARITNAADQDGDGYASQFEVQFDVGSSEGSGTYCVKLYDYATGNPLGTSSTSTVSQGLTDQASIIVNSTAHGFPRGEMSLMAELYNAQTGGLVQVWGPVDDADLGGILVEPAAEDGNEPGDALPSVAEMGSLGLGGSLPAADEIGNGPWSAQDVDFYQFTLLEAGLLTADVDAQSTGSALDAYLRLYDTAGVKLDEEDDTDGKDPTLYRYLPEGTYYLAVSTWKGRTSNPNVAGTANAGTAGVYQLLVSLGSVPEPEGNVVTLGSLTLEGDFQQTADGLTAATGTVLINGILMVKGTLSYDMNLDIRGAGKVYFKDLPSLGNLEIFNGSFHFNASELITDKFNQYAGQLKVVGMNVHATSITLVANGVEVRGSITLPNLCGGIKLDIDKSHFIRLTTTGGITYDVTLTVPKVDMSFGGLDFKAQSAALNLTNVGGITQGTMTGSFLMELPPVASDIEVNLSESEGNYFRIDSAGNVDLIGSISAGRIEDPSGSFYIRDLVIDLDTVSHIYSGEGTLGLPRVGSDFEVSARIAFVEGCCDEISLIASGINRMIWQAPPIYLQKAGGSVWDICEGPLKIEPVLGLSLGPDMGGYRLISVEGRVLIDMGGRVDGEIAAWIGKQESPIADGSIRVIWDKNFGVYVAGQVNAAYWNGTPVLHVHAEAALSSDNSFHGELSGSATIPHNAPYGIGRVAGGKTVSARGYLQYYDDGNDSNDYLIGAVKIDWGWFGVHEHGIEVNMHTRAVDWMADLNHIKQVEFPGIEGAQGGLLMQEASAPEPFPVASGVDWVMFRAAWETGDTDLVLTDPLGNPITPITAGTPPFENILYEKNLAVPEAVYVVMNPTAGNWMLSLTETVGIGAYTLEQLQFTEAPAISLLMPDVPVAGSPVNISWTAVDSDSDAVISLFYDTDFSGVNGALIEANISEDAEPTGSRLWDTSNVSAGEYYIYAVIDDGMNVPAISYAPGRVTVINAGAPPQVTGLTTHGGTDTSLTLRWDPSSDPNLGYYIVRYTDDAAGDWYKESAVAFGPEITLTGLTTGETYRVTVAAVGTPAAIGPDSDAMVVIPGAVATVPPDPDEWAVFAEPGTTYTAQVPGTPAATYTPLVLPAGATMSPTGLFEWSVPASGAEGWHEVLVHVTDPDGITVPQRFHLLVDQTPPQWMGTPQATADTSTAIVVEAPVAQDASGILEYRLERNGVPVGTWQGLPAFLDSGLTPDTTYIYRVQCRDASPNRLESIWGAPATARTLAAVPPPPSLLAPTASSLTILSVSAYVNPPTTEYALYNLTDEAYIDASGMPNQDPTWQPGTAWQGLVINGLVPDSAYQFQTYARNGGGMVTQPGAVATAYTGRETLPPTVESVTIVSGTPSLAIVLSEPISISLKDMSVTDAAGEAVDLSGAMLMHMPGSATATLTMDPLTPPGAYTLKLDGDSIQDLAGNLLDGDADGNPGGDYDFSFTVGVHLTLSCGLQGSSRPDPAGWEIPLIVRLFTPGTDVLSGTPAYTFTGTTMYNSGSGTAEYQAPGVASGTYDITVISEHTLMNVKRNVVITSPSTMVDMGTLLEGDWNGNLTIDWEDLGTVLLTYDKCEGNEGFDPAADFNRNGCIDWEDLGLVLINYDKTSPVEVG